MPDVIYPYICIAIHTILERSTLSVSANQFPELENNYFKLVWGLRFRYDFRCGFKGISPVLYTWWDLRKVEGESFSLGSKKKDLKISFFKKKKGNFEKEGRKNFFKPFWCIYEEKGKANSISASIIILNHVSFLS